MKNDPKADFLRPISSKITPTKKSEMSKRESDGEKKRRREKAKVASLIVYIGLFNLEIFLAEKVCLTQEAYLAKCLSKKNDSHYI